ncbi:MAG: hypothetical protein LBD29_03600 [Treponema sp.]|nr:hypothetical protein [Treponema sp.]
MKKIQALVKTQGPCQKRKPEDFVRKLGLKNEGPRLIAITYFPENDRLFIHKGMESLTLEPNHGRFLLEVLKELYDTEV